MSENTGPSKEQVSIWKSRNFLLPLFGMAFYTGLFAGGCFSETVVTTWITFLASDKVISALFFALCAGVYNFTDLRKASILNGKDPA